MLGWGNVHRISGVLIILCLISGISIVVADISLISPDSGKSGENIPVYVGNLVNNTLVEIIIDGQIKTTVGAPVSYKVRNLYLPFSLKNANISVEIKNLEPDSSGSLVVSASGLGETKKIKNSDNMGVWTYTSSSIPLSNDDYHITFNGTSYKSETPVKTILKGIVNGDFIAQEAMFLNVGGFPNGFFNIDIKTNGDPNPKVRKTFSIQNSLLVSNN